MDIRNLVRGVAAGLSLQLVAYAGVMPGALAESSTGPRGLITSASCPFDCAMAGVPKSSCRSWQAGDECYVEDLSQGPGHRTLLLLPEGTKAPRAAVPAGSRMRRDGQGTWITVGGAGRGGEKRGGIASDPQAANYAGKRGLITSAECPFDCSSAQVPESQCRSWTDGERCFVEDLLQAPGHRSMLSVQ